MFERFTKDVRRAVVRAAEREALELGSATVEAEHLLLALAADEHSPSGQLLTDSGLDHEGVRAALDVESERSLAAVGIAVHDFAAPEPPIPPSRKPRFATSAKRALERTLHVALARDHRRITCSDLLVGLLRADLGTLPRALAAAEVDRVALAASAERLDD